VLSNLDPKKLETVYNDEKQTQYELFLDEKEVRKFFENFKT
jgi:hypothetical protein